jgi:hypothetical protein
MAKVLLEEEQLRKEVQKTLPRLHQRLLDLCEEWKVTFKGTLMLSGVPLADTIKQFQHQEGSAIGVAPTPSRYNTEENAVSRSRQTSRNPSPAATSCRPTSVSPPPSRVNLATKTVNRMK